MTIHLAIKYLGLASIAILYLCYILSVIITFRKTTDSDRRSYQVLAILSVTYWGLSLFWAYKLNSLFTSAILIFIGTVSIGFFYYLQNLIKKHNFSVVFSIDKPHVLLQDGAYKYIRHPFYSLYLFSYFSIAILLQSLALFILACGLCWVYWRALHAEEKKFLNSDFSSDYQAYMRRTGRLVPRIKN